MLGRTAPSLGQTFCDSGVEFKRQGAEILEGKMTTQKHRPLGRCFCSPASRRTFFGCTRSYILYRLSAFERFHWMSFVSMYQSEPFLLPEPSISTQTW